MVLRSEYTTPHKGHKTQQSSIVTSLTDNHPARDFADRSEQASRFLMTGGKKIHDGQTDETTCSVDEEWVVRLYNHNGPLPNYLCTFSGVLNRSNSACYFLHVISLYPPISAGGGG